MYLNNYVATYVMIVIVKISCAVQSVLVSRSQTTIFSFILRPEKIGSGTPTIGKAVLTPTAIWGW